MKYILTIENYSRVIPRDFFNEAKLLKCMGNLAVKILDGLLPDGIDIEISEEYDGDSFDIQLSDTGELYVANYPVIINGQEYLCFTAYNSKGNYPFYCKVYNEELEIFDDNGNFAKEFIDYFSEK